MVARILQNSDIQIAIVIKTQELQRTVNPNIGYDQIVEMLINNVWKKKQPFTLHNAVNDILSISADKLVQHLSVKARKDGYRQSISDFYDVIGGK